MYVCVCVCVCERERESEICVCAFFCMYILTKIFISVFTDCIINKSHNLCICSSRQEMCYTKRNEEKSFGH